MMPASGPRVVAGTHDEKLRVVHSPPASQSLPQRPLSLRGTRYVSGLALKHSEHRVVHHLGSTRVAGGVLAVVRHDLAREGRARVEPDGDRARSPKICPHTGSLPTYPRASQRMTMRDRAEPGQSLRPRLAPAVRHEGGPALRGQAVRKGTVAKTYVGPKSSRVAALRANAVMYLRVDGDAESGARYDAPPWLVDRRVGAVRRYRMLVPGFAGSGAG